MTGLTLKKFPKELDGMRKKEDSNIIKSISPMPKKGGVLVLVVII